MKRRINQTSKTYVYSAGMGYIMSYNKAIKIQIVLATKKTFKVNTNISGFQLIIQNVF